MARSTAQIMVDYPEWAGSQNFVTDYRQAVAAALRAKDDGGHAELNTLWLDLFEFALRSMGPRKLKAYLETSRVWQSVGLRPVYKMGVGPALAFSADVFPDGSVELIGIGICYRFPGGSESDWWTNVIEPRAKAL